MGRRKSSSPPIILSQTFKRNANVLPEGGRRMDGMRRGPRILEHIASQVIRKEASNFKSIVIVLRIRVCLITSCYAIRNYRVYICQTFTCARCTGTGVQNRVRLKIPGLAASSSWARHEHCQAADACRAFRILPVGNQRSATRRMLSSTTT